MAITDLVPRRPWVRVMVVAVVVAVVALGGYGMYLGSVAGRLPWQTDPTRISTALTPFAGIPGVGAPVAATGLPTGEGSPSAGVVGNDDAESS